MTPPASRRLTQSKDRVNSPWYGVIFIGIAVALGWVGLDVLHDGVVTVKDKLGVLRTLRGEYAAMFAWSYLAAAAALAVGGVATIVRERGRRRPQASR